MSTLSPASTSANTVPFNKDVNVQLNSDSWKHASTYSEDDFDRLLTEIEEQIEQFNCDALQAASKHTEQINTLIDKAQNDMDVQFEQVKADLDRTLMNDLKRVDKRMQMLESSLQSLSESRQPSSSQTVIILVALSIVLSLANMIILFVHH